MTSPQRGNLNRYITYKNIVRDRPIRNFSQSPDCCTPTLQQEVVRIATGQIVKRTNFYHGKIVKMSKSRILPCETAQNILWDLWIVQGIKPPIWLFGAKNIRQQYLQSSLGFTIICINKQNFRYHLTSAIHIDIIQTVSKKKSLLLQHILIFMKEGFYHGNYKEDCC